jgi:hypothetical protein
MQCHHHGYLVELPDDWWAEASMEDFVPRAIAYGTSSVGPNGQFVLIIALSDIADVGPERRKIGIFREFGRRSSTEKSHRHPVRFSLE